MRLAAAVDDPRGTKAETDRARREDEEHPAGHEAGLRPDEASVAGARRTDRHACAGARRCYDRRRGRCRAVPVIARRLGEEGKVGYAPAETSAVARRGCGVWCSCGRRCRRGNCTKTAGSSSDLVLDHGKHTRIARMRFRVPTRDHQSARAKNGAAADKLSRRKSGRLVPSAACCGLVYRVVSRLAPAAEIGPVMTFGHAR